MLLFFFFMSDLVISGSDFHPDSEIQLKAWANHQFETVAELNAGSDGTFQIKLAHQKPNLFLISIEGDRVELAIQSASAVHLKRQGKSILVSGSPNTEAARGFDRKLNQLNQSYFGDLKVRAETVLEGDDKAAKEALLQERDQALEKFWAELQKNIEDLGPTPAGFSALQVLDIHKQHDFIAKQLPIFEKALPDSPIAATIRNWVVTSKSLAVGQLAPDFELSDASGATVSSSTWMGKYVFLDFWASWCPNCKAEFPDLVEVYERFKSQGLQVIGVTARDNKQAWEQTQKRFKLPWPNFFEDRPLVTERFAAKQLPTNFLIDPKGNIVLRNVTARELERYLSQMLN